MKFTAYGLAALMFLAAGCQRETAGTPEVRRDYPQSLKIFLDSGALTRSDVLVELKIADLKAKKGDFNPAAAAAFAGDRELPLQSIDQDRDGRADVLAVLADFPNGGTRELTLFYAPSGEKKRDYPQRAQAEISRKSGGHFENRKYIGGEFENVTALKVPPEHTDHSFFIRYEGPGWESDRVGYRFYLDWRNATDIFGKKTGGMVLQQVGLDGFDSYHEMSDWGMDILKVGESLGIGSPGMWTEDGAMRVSQTDSLYCEIADNGPLFARVHTDYAGWQVAGARYDLSSELSIAAGSRLTRHDLQISGDPPNLCTGIVKHPGTVLLDKSPNASGWGYLATYGRQSLAEDELGMAVLFRQEDFQSFQEDEYSEVVVLKPRDGQLRYYFLAAWSQEPDGIRGEAAFMAYLETLVKELNTPVEVRY